MEAERQQRVYEVAAQQWEMATGNAKPRRGLSGCQVAPSEVAAERVKADLMQAKQRQRRQA